MAETLISVLAVLAVLAVLMALMTRWRRRAESAQRPAIMGCCWSCGALRSQVGQGLTNAANDRDGLVDLGAFLLGELVAVTAFISSSMNS